MRVVDICLINDSERPYEEYVIRQAVQWSQTQLEYNGVALVVEGEPDVDKATIHALRLDDASLADRVKACDDVNGLITYSRRKPQRRHVPEYGETSDTTTYLESAFVEVGVVRYRDYVRPFFFADILDTGLPSRATMHELGHVLITFEHEPHPESLMHDIIGERSYWSPFMTRRLRRRLEAIAQGDTTNLLAQFTRPAASYVLVTEREP